MANVGFATVQIVPSFKGMQKQIRSELAGMGDVGSKSFSERFSQGLKTGLTRAFKVGIGSAVAGATYIGYKGWDRLLNIEDAEAKLRGLGHTAETIEEVTARALAAVDGTPYALDKAMTVASGLLASGVPAGEELERVLGLVADSATLAGADLGEMGSVWNRIFASGRVQAQELNMIGDRGIPIFQLLAEHFDTTVDGVREMGAAGTITANDFAEAMSTYEGAAKSAGDTTRGAWANFNTSLAKMGADALKPFQPIVKEALDDAKAWVQEITPAVREFVEDAIQGFKDLKDWIDRNKSALEDAAVAAGSFTSAFLFSKYFTTGVSTLKTIPGMITNIGTSFKKLGTVLKANWIFLLIGAVVAGIALIVKNWDVIGPKVKEFYDKYLSPVVAKIKKLWDNTLWPIFDGIRSFLVDTLWPVMKDVWNRVLGVIKTVWNSIKGIWDSVWSTTKSVWDNISGWVLGAWGTISSVTTTVWGAISSAISTAWDSFLKPVFTAIWGFINDRIIPIFQWLWSNVVEPVWNFISWHISAAWNTIRLVFDVFVFALTHLGDAFSWLWNNVISPVASWIAEKIVGAWNWVYEATKDVWNKVFEIITTVWDGISAAISWVWENVIKVAFNAIKSFIENTLAPAFVWFYENVIKPVWDGISTAITWAWDSVIKPLFNGIKSFIENTLAPAFTWLKDTVILPVWDAIGSGIGWAWDNVIKPIFNGIKSFLENTLAPAFTTFKDIAVGAFESLANLLLDPVQFIVNTVYNDGIKKAFDAVAQAVGSSARLPSAHISDFNFTRRSAAPRTATPRPAHMGGGNTFSGAYAKGGYAPPGWALVGEEGPELVNFDRPGRVYTAHETAMALRGSQIDPGLIPDRLYDRADASFALSALRSGDPDMLALAAGGDERDALLPVGGLWNSIGSTWSKTWRGAVDVVTTVAGKTVEFVRGALADAAELILNPVKGLIRSTLHNKGQIPHIFGDIGLNSIDNVLSWIRGIDDEDEKTAWMSGTLDAAAMKILESQIPMVGGSARPVRGGRLTSLFGPRWGGHHAGVDWAVPVGTPVHAWRSGVVRRAGWNALAGRTGIGIEIGHRDGFGSYYGHLSQVLARVGQSVMAGQMIGRSGNTGRSTGPHLHFEISRNNNPHAVVNPLPYLHDNGGLLNPGLSLLLNNTKKPEYVLNDKQWRDISGLALSRQFQDEVMLVDANGSIIALTEVAARRGYTAGAEEDRRWG